MAGHCTYEGCNCWHFNLAFGLDGVWRNCTCHHHLNWHIGGRGTLFGWKEDMLIFITWINKIKVFIIIYKYTKYIILLNELNYLFLFHYFLNWVIF